MFFISSSRCRYLLKGPLLAKDKRYAGCYWFLRAVSTCPCSIINSMLFVAICRSQRLSARSGGGWRATPAGCPASQTTVFVSTRPSGHLLVCTAVHVDGGSVARSSLLFIGRFFLCMSLSFRPAAWNRCLFFKRVTSSVTAPRACREKRSQWWAPFAARCARKLLFSHTASHVALCYSMTPSIFLLVSFPLRE